MQNPLSNKERHEGPALGQQSLAGEILSSHNLAHGRDNTDSYTSYYLGMDQTQAQKVALSTAHMPTSDSLVYDMGFGTGRGSYDLSQLYPQNVIVGVDIDPNAIHHAKARYHARNLSFETADISAVHFPTESADVIFCSSILHEVLSYAQRDRFNLKHLERVLDAHVTMLKPGGKYIVRDFISAQWPRHVFLDLPSRDGTESGPYANLSTASLFTDFVKNFRCREFPEGNISLAVFDRGDVEPGWRRFMVPSHIAQEFILRRNYCERWEEEMPEEYSYRTQPEFEDMFAERGLRLITAQEIHNPWIERNWFDGKFRISDFAGNLLPFPPTNFIIVGEKVREGEGVLIRERSVRQTDQPVFLERTSFRSRNGSDSAIFDVISRPGQSTDFLAYHEDLQRNEITILVKAGYPRPILNAGKKSHNLDNATTGGYTLETVTAALPQAREEEATAAFADRTGLDPSEFSLEKRPHMPYFPSPGTSDETVEVRRVRLARKPDSRQSGGNHSRLATSGELRGIDSRQTLRAFQVGGMSDPRLEINIYRLHLERSVSVGTWIGASVPSLPQLSAQSVGVESVKNLLSQRRAPFEPVPQPEEISFFSIYSGTFEEVDAGGQPLANVTLEYIVPSHHSTNTATLLPFARISPDDVLVFVEERDFPAVQKRTGNSALITIPGFRLDPRTTTVDQMIGEIRARAYMEFGIEAQGKPVLLGGKYYPSIGFSPETAYPYAVEVDLSAQRPENASSHLTPVLLRDLLRNQHLIQDAHLLTSLFRLSHALGEFE
jgi:ubiquinone/menaquinone biosynthesis C-methylase UbiE